jgi:hypothetical protein
MTLGSQLYLEGTRDLERGMRKYALLNLKEIGLDSSQGAVTIFSNRNVEI